MKCPSCGYELPDGYDSSFCDECGNDLFCCVDPECSVYGVLVSFANNCTQCGNPLEPNGPREGAVSSAASVEQASSQASAGQAAQQAAAATVQQDPGQQAPPAGQTPVQQVPVQQAPPAGQVPVQHAASTEFMAVSGSKLFFNHSDGWTMELADGDILGRVNGNHVDRLGGVAVLSGTHAKITRQQDGWYIADQKSLNKTWVNGKIAEPYVPVRIKQNDVVTLASQKFTVIEG